MPLKVDTERVFTFFKVSDLEATREKDSDSFKAERLGDKYRATEETNGLWKQQPVLLAKNDRSDGKDAPNRDKGGDKGDKGGNGGDRNSKTEGRGHIRVEYEGPKVKIEGSGAGGCSLRREKGESNKK